MNVEKKTSNISCGLVYFKTKKGWRRKEKENRVWGKTKQYQGGLIQN
jgi:hypothetical protein